MRLEQIKLEFEKEHPAPTDALEMTFGKQWHIEWLDKIKTESPDEHLSYLTGLWAGFLSGYVRAEKNQKGGEHESKDK